MIAEITAYDVGLFIHVLAVLAGLGPTAAYPVIISWVERFNPEAVPGVYSGIGRTDHLLVTPGLVLILFSGLYLVTEGELSLGETWVSVGLGAVVVLLGISHGYLTPRIRRGIELAERDLAAGGSLSEEFRRLSREIALGGAISSLLVVVTIFFMTVKP